MSSKTYERFQSRLTSLGYCEFVSCFNPLTFPMHLWEARRDSADVKLKPIVDLLLLNRTVPLDSIDADLRKYLPELSEEGVFSIADGCVRTTQLVLYPMYGLWLFFQKPTVNMMMYYGADSAALIMRQRPRRGKTCLDLCSGPGIQALYAAAHGERVTSVEINPFAAQIAKFNARFNSLLVDVRLGNLYTGVPGMKFDRITANPPLLPFAETIAYPFVGHGGNDGLKITRSILRGLPDALAENGYAQIIGTGLSNGKQACFKQELDDLGKQFGLDILCTITYSADLIRGSSMFNSLVYTAEMATGMANNQIADEFERVLKQQDASHLIAFYFFVQHGQGGLTIMDTSQGNDVSFWYLT